MQTKYRLQYNKDTNHNIYHSNSRYRHRLNPKHRGISTTGTPLSILA